jgi:pimeloyl-ACP methyl ester carboxylesterase
MENDAMKALTTRDGAMTAVQVGSGSDLVVLHSLLCDRSAFDAVVPALAAKHRVTLINLPGFHGSRPVDGSVAAYVGAIAGAIEEFGVGQDMTLLGNGFGGTLALALALEKPRALSRLVIVDAAAGFPDAGRKAFVAMAATVRDHGMSAVATVAARRVYHDSYIERYPDVVDERRAVLLGIEPGSFLAACGILARCDILPDLHAIATPTLVIYGSLDQATPPDLNRAIARAIPGAQIREIEDCGHCPPLEKPAEFLSALQGFVTTA